MLVQPPLRVSVLDAPLRFAKRRPQRGALLRQRRQPAAHRLSPRARFAPLRLVEPFQPVESIHLHLQRGQRGERGGGLAVDALHRVRRLDVVQVDPGEGGGQTSERHACRVGPPLQCEQPLPDRHSVARLGAAWAAIGRGGGRASIAAADQREVGPLEVDQLAALPAQLVPLLLLQPRYHLAPRPVERAARLGGESLHQHKAPGRQRLAGHVGVTAAAGRLAREPRRPALLLDPLEVRLPVQLDVASLRRPRRLPRRRLGATTVKRAAEWAAEWAVGQRLREALRRGGRRGRRLELDVHVDRLSRQKHDAAAEAVVAERDAIHLNARHVRRCRQPPRVQARLLRVGLEEGRKHRVHKGPLEHLASERELERDVAAAHEAGA
mmetsp:Transcript_11776/g.38784  ORF Transcript_11776/g.38784 Transcript_11776/m.38784 type:complete len:381 (+) Transcript_11776:134-1276(+)